MNWWMNELFDFAIWLWYHNEQELDQKLQIQIMIKHFCHRSQELNHPLFHWWSFWWILIFIEISASLSQSIKRSYFASSSFSGLNVMVKSSNQIEWVSYVSFWLECHGWIKRPNWTSFVGNFRSNYESILCLVRQLHASEKDTFWYFVHNVDTFLDLLLKLCTALVTLARNLV